MMHYRPGNAGASDRSDRAGKIVRLFERLGHLGMRFFGERRGNVVIVFAVALTVIVGAVGLGTDAASWYATKRAMQNAADLAAAGAINSLKSYYPCTTNCTTKAGYAKNEGKSAAALHGYVDATGGTAVNIQVKAVDSAIYSSANYTGAPDYGAAEVVVTQPAPLHFASLFMTSSPTIVARAVTVINPTNGDCIYALNHSAAQSFQINGGGSGGNVTVSCGIAIASTATAADCSSANNAKDAAGYINGSGTVTSTSLSVAGNYCVSGNGSFTTTQVPADHNVPPDPYAGTTVPTPTGVQYGAFSDTSTTTGTMQPGIYTSITINGTQTLMPGTYFVEGGNFSVRGEIAHSPGVTIILTSTTPNSTPVNHAVGTFTMDSNAKADMSAPTSTGMLVFQDPNAPPNSNCGQGNGVNCNTLQGGPSVNLTGYFYMPNGNLTYAGNSSLRSTGCLQLIADTVYWSGHPTLLVNGCANAGVTQFGPTTVSMAE